MLVRNIKKVPSTGTRRGRRGFTLVELIVVLTVLALLAAIGVASLVGYIDRSRFDENSQSAITVYQTAQTSLTNMESNGALNQWVLDTFGTSHFVNYGSLDAPNKSDHATVALTFNPKTPGNAEDKALHDLLCDDFYDQSIFSGTMTVVFDISATKDATGIINHSAYVIGAFYSKQNDSEGGWRADYINGNTDGDPWNTLPDRTIDYRMHTSFVGYFDGSEGSLAAVRGSGAVFFPEVVASDPVVDPVGPIAGSTVDPNEVASGFLFNLRNGETLDVMWSIFPDEEFGSRDPYMPLTISLIPGSGSAVKINITRDFYNTPVTSPATTIYENIKKGDLSFSVTKVSREGLATVSVTCADGTTRDLVFPLTVTQVTGDRRLGAPSTGAYTMYTLSLDCMMTRSLYDTNGLTSVDNYSSTRLFGDQNPRNICATIQSAQTTIIPATYASRAINDPIFFYNIQMKSSHSTLCYNTRFGVAENDTNDPSTNTYICRVNTLFGDLKYNDTIGGSFAGTSGNAVITSFRHLSNIRMMGTNSGINFRIARDLDWYIHKPGVSRYSEARVYTTSAADRFHTPYTIGESDIRIVSFPAIGKLSAGQTLSSLPRLDGQAGNYSINNVQLRVASFDITGGNADAGYGLICSNAGVVNNIYTNNLNMVLVDVPDGTTSDYPDISCGSTQIINDDGTEAGITLLGDKPIGGLIGLNTGTVGIPNSTTTDGNTIRMSNTIILAGDYWNIAKYKIATGGVIGENNSDVNGMITFDGGFAVVGRDNVGGIIGHTNHDVGAVLVVNGGAGQGIPASEFTLPGESVRGGAANMSCVIAARNSVGGAIGLIESSKLTYAVSNPFSSSEIQQNTDTGAITFADRNLVTNYNISVNLPTGSLVYQIGAFDDRASGGAIGIMDSCSGNASIRVVNDGRIVISNNYVKAVHSGGVIGLEINCSMTNLYIDVHNGPNSRIGYHNDSYGPRCAGGAIGYMNCSAAGRTVAINVVNEGTIISRGGDLRRGTGGAIGATSKNTKVTFFVSVVNRGSSDIAVTEDSGRDKLDGVGGAIGAMSYGDGSKTTEILTNSILYVENYGTIEGYYRVGGAIGLAGVNSGSIYTVNRGSTITGRDFVGGAIGSEYEPQQGLVQSILYGGTNITGENFVGGAAGAIQSFSDNATIATIVRDGASTVQGSGSLIGGVCGDLKLYPMNQRGSLTLRGDGSDTTTLNVIGSTADASDYIGGAVGLLRSSKNNIVWNVSMPDQSESNKLALNINGHSYVGGAIGELCALDYDVTYDPDKVRTAPAQNKDYRINLNVVLSPDSHIVGTDAHVGGAVGRVIGASGSRFYGSLSVSTSAGTLPAVISGLSSVGGAVGRFETTYPAVYNDSEINIDFSQCPCNITATATEGDANVGGAIGYVGSSTYRGDSVPKITVLLGESNITSGASNVGGAIGKTEIKNGNNTLYQRDISVTYAGPDSGSCNITGVDSVGGVIGYNESKISGSVTFTVTGYAHVVGNYYVGGAIGYSLNNVSNVTSDISTDNAVQGVKFIGGVIGRLGSDTVTASAGTVRAVVNVAYPIYQTSVVSSSDDACIGGVIGQVARGTVTAVDLTGSGASASVDSSLIPNFQTRNYSNIIIIPARGRSIGGVIGLIGDGTNKDAKVLSISAGNGTATTPNTLGLAVISMNGSQRIGGCVGASFGTIGNGWSNTTISIPCVKVVYSNSECVGGFCGLVNRNTSDIAYINARVYVDLDNAVITGRARVGGIIGDINGAKIDGNVRVSLNNSTRIGDFNGSVTTATDAVDTSNCICVEAGGAIGRVINTTITTNAVKPTTDRSNVEDHTPIRTTDSYGRVSVEILDEGSKIFAGSTDVSNLADGLTINEAGVGGAVGRMSYSGTYGQSNTYEACMYVYSPSTYISVYSAGASAGGGIGHILNGEYRGCYATASVRCDGDDGFGIIGTGGLIGKMDTGRVYNCYCGGHTVNGQYIPGFENVSGINNVGGFLGYAGSGVSVINQCYSTASVRGTDCVGGLVGRIVSTTNNLFQECYCTGLVSGFDPSETDPENFGSFAGWAAGLNVFRNSGTKSANKIVRAQNRHILRVGNLTTVGNGQVYPARFELRDGGPYYVYGDDCIRTNGASNYTAYPFDQSLFPSIIPPADYPLGTIYFPLRTFISYQVGSTWYGTHYGDWPVIPNDNILDYQNVTINGMSYPYTNLRYPYSNIGQFIPLEHIVVTFVETTLTVNTDYTVSFFTRGATEGTVVITGIGDYYGPVPINFIIDPANITTLYDSSKLTVTGIEDSYDYTGSPIEPVPTLTWNGLNLTAGTDYTVTYTNNVECGGTATVTITGIGNYTGTITKTFEISTAEIHDSDVTGLEDSYVYTGDAITPVPVIHIGTRDLIAGTDYVITYSDNNVNAGETVTITISQKDGSNYTIATPIERTFTITRAPFNTATFVGISGETYPYTGAEIRPVEITFNGHTLVEGTDYTISYSDDVINAGDKSVSIEGIGNFEGTVVGTYTITPLEITDESISGIEERYFYTGLAIEPAPTVTVGGVTLANTDYTVAYSDNVNIGTATITVTGQGNYTSTATKTFDIVPETCTVTFEADGEIYGDAVIVNYGEPVSVPSGTPSSSYDYLVFDYWAYEDTDIPYDFSAPVTSDMTIEAYWANLYTVTFDSNGGSAVAAAKVKDGESVAQPADPVWDGHNFLGWYTADDTLYDWMVPVVSDITLTAHWEEINTDTQSGNNDTTVPPEDPEAPDPPDQNNTGT